LGYIFQATVQVDFYAFFKYLLPLFALLVLFPAALVARQLSERWHQFLVFFFPLANAAFILYLFMPIPQAIFNISLSFFVFFLLYSWLTGKDIFYFLAGVLMLITYFYHEVALLFLFPWVFISVITYRRQLLTVVHRQWLALTLLAVLILSHPKIFAPFITFFFNWAKHIFASAHRWHTNLTFPLHFINVDGRITGWGSLQGVVQYYAFYMGPACALAALFLIFFLPKKENRLPLWQEIRTKKEFWVLSLIGVFFLTLAEILPRVMSVALLPERALSTLAFLIIAFTIILLKVRPGKHRIATFLLLGAIILNIGAALYVNSLKKYLVTEEQLAAAQWIKSSLPEEKILFTAGNESLLKVHANVEVTNVPYPDFYRDLNIFETYLRATLAQHYTLEPKEEKRLGVITRNLESLREITQREDDEVVRTALLDLQKRNEDVQAILIERHNKLPIPASSLPVYIFYSKPSSKNPYANRPYFQSLTEDQLVFDAYPERFQRIYEAQNDSVVIWQLKK
jgi:hypothetical protein